MISAALSCAPERPAAAHGFATRYAPGVMQRVAIKRRLAFRERNEQCGVAYDGPPRAPLGALVWVRGVRTGVSRLCMVVDVSHPRDLARHRRAKLIELDSRSARAICGKQHWRSGWRECPVRFRPV